MGLVSCTLTGRESNQSSILRHYLLWTTDPLLKIVSNCGNLRNVYVLWQQPPSGEKKLHAHQGIATNKIIHYILLYTQATDTSAYHNAYIPTHNLKIQSFRGHSSRTQERNNSSAWVIELLHFCANPSFCLPGVRDGVHGYNKLPACKYHTPPVETGRIRITLIAIKKSHIK